MEYWGWYASQLAEDDGMSQIGISGKIIRSILILCIFIVFTACSNKPGSHAKSDDTPPKFESQANPNQPANTAEEQVVLLFKNAGPFTKPS